MQKYLILAATLLLTACGEPVQIPSGYVGRILNTSGLDNHIIQPTTMRLDFCFFSACPRMILLETGLDAEDISIGTVFLPKSNVDLSDVKLALQFRIKPDVQAQDRVYKEVPPKQVSGDVYSITSQQLYAIYLKRLVPNVIISLLRDYTVEEALANVDVIAKEALKKIHAEMGDVPIEVVEVGFPNGVGKPPDAVLEVKRQLYVVKETISRQVAELEGSLRVEQQRQIVQALRVKNDVQNATAAGLPVDIYMALKVTERFADEKTPLGFFPKFK